MTIIWKFVVVYCESKKTSHYNIVHNFAK